jgi:NAD(P)-dependent dehydrogenase (short-subunit alcohol dehydrogenase family)
MAPFQFASDISYLLAGGLGGIGRSLARWMHSQGAKNFIFLSRSGAASKEARALVEDLEKGSCRVKICICVVGEESQLRAAIAECRVSMPPIKGCIQGSMVLEVSLAMSYLHVQCKQANRVP